MGRGVGGGAGGTVCLPLVGRRVGEVGGLCSLCSLCCLWALVPALPMAGPLCLLDSLPSCLFASPSFRLARDGVVLVLLAMLVLHIETYWDIVGRPGLLRELDSPLCCVFFSTGVRV